jgi:hypothetical protein
MSYTPHFTVWAEGYRVGLTTCRECGAVVLLGDNDFDGAKAHVQWHEQRDKPEKASHE